MGRRLVLGVAFALVALIGFVAWVKLERRRPTAALARPPAALGRGGTIDVTLRDVGTGLAWGRVEVESNGATTVLASEAYPAQTWRGSGLFETTISTPLAPIDHKLGEGPATLRVFAGDYSWLRWLRSDPAVLEAPFTIDLSPPTLEVLSPQHHLTLGGLEFMLYKTSPDAVRSGVAVASYFFPGTAGLFADPTIHAAFFAMPQDLDRTTAAKAVAEDAAGNRREVMLHAVVKPRTFADRTLDLDDAFLERKVPEILAASRLPAQPDLVQGYLYVNRTVRRNSEVRIKDVTRASAATPRWDGAFLRQPNSAPLAGFGDRRSYRHDGAIIDTQTHLGYDLASLRQAPVVAASAGTVVLADYLGIYGDAVIIDHGLGIFSLYGHLSAITVRRGQEVQRGETVGRTGETGLAGGDHLHFSVMLYGVHVDPVEWWDGKWIRDHVTAKLEQYPRATTTATRDE
ncbi:MAG: M23 family metallopeptidase [Deltaproteobacteria bacterium]|nr:M23 family metallopeptidase [Deltaproteobacteria bacterium]